MTTRGLNTVSLQFSLHKQEYEATSGEKSKNPKNQFRLFIHSKDSKVNLFFFFLKTEYLISLSPLRFSFIYFTHFSCAFVIPDLREAFYYQGLSHRAALLQLFLHKASTSHFKILSCLINFYFLSPHLLYYSHFTEDVLDHNSYEILIQRQLQLF